MSREVPDAWRRFCSGSIFYTISRAVFTSMEWRCHLSNCKRFASKPSYQNGRQSMQRTFWLSSKTPIHRKFSPKYFHVQYLGDMSAKIPARNPWLAGLGDTFLISWTSITRATFLKYPSQCSLSPLASITQIFASFMSIYPIGCRQATFFAFDPGYSGTCK